VTQQNQHQAKNPDSDSGQDPEFSTGTGWVDMSPQLRFLDVEVIASVKGKVSGVYLGTREFHSPSGLVTAYLFHATRTFPYKTADEKGTAEIGTTMAVGKRIALEKLDSILPKSQEVALHFLGKKALDNGRTMHEIKIWSRPIQGPPPVTGIMVTETAETDDVPF